MARFQRGRKLRWLAHYDGVLNGSTKVTEPQPQLVRAIGRWTLSALMVNTIVGAGIAGLPSLLAGHLGRLSPAGYFLAAPGVALIVACFAEVASQFQQAGGPYLYTRIAFGRFMAEAGSQIRCVS